MGRYALDILMHVPENELDPYRNMQILLNAGEEIPVFYDGKMIGRGLSCSLCDGMVQEYTPESTDTAVRIRFLLTTLLLSDGQMIEIFPDLITFGGKDNISKFFLIRSFNIVKTAELS